MSKGSHLPCEVCGHVDCDNHYATPTLCIAQLRIERDQLRADIQSYVIVREEKQGEIMRLRADLARVTAERDRLLIDELQHDMVVDQLAAARLEIEALKEQKIRATSDTICDVKRIDQLRALLGECKERLSEDGIHAGLCNPRAIPVRCVDTCGLDDLLARIDAATGGGA